MHDLEFIPDIKPKLLPFAMKSEVTIELVGLLAYCRIIQTFTNTTDSVIEGIHTIPVPVESTLTAFKVSKNNQDWLGQVYARTEADTRYEQSLDEGNSAFQLKREADFISLFLGNLLSKETLSLELSIIFPIQFIAGQGQLYLPLVMGERYGQSNLLPEQEPTSSFLAEYPLTIRLLVSYLPTDSRIESPSHPLKYQGNGNYQASGVLDRDLKILFNDLPEIKPTLQTLKLDEKNTLGLITLITPQQTTEHVSPKDILFVLDCSGSMQGAPIQQLRESVVAMLGELRPQDRFNLYPYGSSVEQVFDAPQAATKEKILQAKQYLRRNLKANLGGTETVSAILTALMSYQKDRTTDVILVTDGEIWLDEGAVQTKLLRAYANQNSIRFFTVGVGHAACEKTVKTLAEMSNGCYLITNPHEDIRFQMQAHFKRLFQTDVKVAINTPNQWQHIPKVYQGDAVLIPLWFESCPETLECDIHVNAELTHYRLNPQMTRSPELAKWIASQRYESLPQHQQIEFAVQHQILTEHTDYLIEMERAERDQTERLSTMIQVPQMQVHRRDDLSMPMFSRKSNDTLSPPTFLRRSSPKDQFDSLSIHTIQEKIVDYCQKRGGKQEQIEIQSLIDYLNSLIDHPEQIDYSRLAQLYAPETLIAWLRLAVLKDQIPAVIQQINALAKNCHHWSDFAERIRDNVKI